MHTRAPQTAIGDKASCVWAVSATESNLRVTFEFGVRALPLDKFVFAPGVILIPGASTRRQLRGATMDQGAWGSKVRQLRGATKPTFENKYGRGLDFTVFAPPAYAPPLARISAPASIGKCDVLRLDSAMSSGGGSLPLKLSWSWSGTDKNVSDALTTASGSNSAAVVLKFGPGVKRGIAYHFNLNVTNQLTQLSGAFSARIFISDRNIPTVVISVGSFIAVRRSQALSLRGFGALPACGATASLGYTWSIVSKGSAIDRSKLIGMASSTMQIPSNLLPAGITTTFRVTAFVVGKPAMNSSANIDVQCKSEPVVATVKGGSLRSISQPDTLELDASGSYDPDVSLSAKAMIARLTFFWSCTYNNTDSCPSNLFTSATSAKTVVAKKLLTGGETYTFFVAVAVKGATGRNASVASQSVFIALGNPPKVAISAPSAAKVNPNDRLTLKSSTASLTAFALQWSIYDSNQKALNVNDPALLSTLPTDRNLVIAEDALKQGETYRFRLVATDINGQQGFAEASLEMNIVPANGIVKSDPSSGMAVRDTFTVHTYGWVDEDFPLLYTFAAKVCTDSCTTFFLSDATLDRQTTAKLPIMNTSKSDRVYVIATDAYGGAASADVATPLVVAPYEKPANVSLQDVTANLLAEAKATGDTSVAKQIVTGLVCHDSCAVLWRGCAL